MFRVYLVSEIPIFFYSVHLTSVQHGGVCVVSFAACWSHQSQTLFRAVVCGSKYLLVAVEVEVQVEVEVAVVLPS